VPSMTPTVRADFALGGTVAAAWSAFALGVRRSLANWPILFGRSLFYLVAMTVLTALWDKVSAQRLAGTLASSLPPSGLKLYVGVTEWITLSVASIHLRLEDDIRLGMLEPHLLRPKPYLLQKIAEAMGDSAAPLLGLGAAALLALALSGRALPPAVAFLYIAILGPIGTALGVLIYAGVGLAAFWVRRVLPPYIIVQKIWFLLGGLFAPISLYPAWFFSLSVASPFAASIFMPGNMMIAPSVAGFVEALAAQCLWLTALAGLVALIWRAGLRKVLREGM